MKSFLATIFFGLALFVAYQFAGKEMLSESAVGISIGEFFSSLFGGGNEEPEVLVPAPLYDPAPVPVFVNEQIKDSAPDPVIVVATPIANVDLRQMVLDILDSEMVYSRTPSTTGTPGPRGATGAQGPQGPRGDTGPSGASVDTSSFVTYDFLTGQVNRIYDSVGDDDDFSLPDGGTAGQVLTTDGAGVVTWEDAAVGGASQWTTTGSDIYYTTGNVGVGTTNPANKFVVSDGSGALGLEINTIGGTNGGVDLLSYDRNASQYEPISIMADSFLVNIANNLDALVISNNGNVGIGATIPSSLLDLESADPVLTLTDTTLGSTLWQIRNGTSGAGKFSVYDATNAESMLTIIPDAGGGQMIIGADQNYGGLGNSSRLFVYGGQNGANIDVMGDGSIVGGDQATIELQSSDYESTFKSMYMQYSGVNGIGTTMGFSNVHLGQLTFQDVSTALIRTIGATPIIFGTNDTERMRLDENGNLGIGDATPDETLSVNRSSSTGGVTNSSAAKIAFTADGQSLLAGGINDRALYVDFDVTAQPLTGRNQNVFGADIDLDSTSDLSNASQRAYGLRIDNSFTGTPTVNPTTHLMYGTFTNVSGDLGTTGSTSHAGHSISVSGTADTNYGIAISTVSGGTDNYSIYSSTDAQSYFAGNMAINSATADSNFGLVVSSEINTAISGPTGAVKGYYGGLAYGALGYSDYESCETNVCEMVGVYGQAAVGGTAYAGYFESAHDSAGVGILSTGSLGTGLDVYSDWTGIRATTAAAGGSALYASAANGSHGVYIVGDLAAYALYSESAAQSYFAGNVGIGTGMTAPSVALDITGDIEYTGTITDVSDRRLKENIENFDGALKIISSLEAKTYNMTGEDGTEVGFLAQDVKELFPGATSIIDPEKGYLGVSYVSLVPVISQAVRELNLNLESIALPFDEENEETFADRFFARISEWMADATNGVTKIFTNEIETQNLCVSDESGDKTCITKAELDQLLQNAGQGSVINSGENNNTEAPIVEEQPVVEEPVVADPAQPVEEIPVEEVTVDEEIPGEAVVPAEETVAEEPTTVEPTLEIPAVVE